MLENPTPLCGIYIDKDGTWFYKGAEMIRHEIIQLFYTSMKMDSQGHYTIEWNGQKCYVEVEDTPFIVRRTELVYGNQAEESKIIIYLSNGVTEDLKLDTLYIGNKNVLYCKIKERAFPARFCRAAYYQLAGHIEEEDGKFYITVGEIIYKIE